MNNTPLTSIDSFFSDLLRRMDRIDAKISDKSQAIPPNELGIKLMKAYTARETAVFLSVDRDSVYKIPENELPWVRRAGSGKGYLGIQILRYMHGLDPLDTESMVEELSRTIKNSLASTTRTAIRPLNGSTSTKTRVL